MAISHTHTDTKDSSATGPATLAPAKPTGTVSTDVLILAMCVSNNGSATGSYTAPSGWTSVGNVTSTGNVIRVDVWWALGSVASTTFTKSGTVNAYGLVMAAFAGVDNTTPIDATGTANSNTGSATLTVNAVTIVTDQAWELIGTSDWNGGTFSATGFTVSASATTGEETALLYNTTPKSTGSTGTVTLNDSASASAQSLCAVPFALRPASSFLPKRFNIIGQSIKRASNY
jgi:hypothetical protein